MKSLIAAAAFIATLGLGAAQAMPVAPVQADGLTTQVAQGCGPGMARNPAGRCRRIRLDTWGIKSSQTAD